VQNIDLKSTISNLNAKVDSIITYNNSLGEVNKVLITKMDKLLEMKMMCTKGSLIWYLYIGG